MRKLLPAIAMLLVSAVMMSTASFAWFTMNTSVEANNMIVTAVAPESIWISPDNTVWSSSMTFANANTHTGNFKPVTPNAQPTDFGTAHDWTFWELTDEASQLVPANGQIEIVDGTGAGLEGKKVVKDTNVVAYEDSTSFFKDIMYLKLDAQPGTEATIYVKAAVSHADDDPDDIWKALRVAVVVDGQILTFEFSTLNKTGELVYTEAQPITEKLEVSSVGTEVNVYAWIEGTDTDCMNENALNLDAFEIDLVFTTEAPTP